MGQIVNIKQQQYPDWLDIDLWNDYLEYRREAKKPLTKTGEKRALMKLERFLKDGGDQTLIIERSIECNWLGLFQQKPEAKKQEFNIKDENAVIRRGKELGKPPKPGETMEEYKLRLQRAR